MTGRSTSILLADVELVRPIGRGGMADVWYGLHRPTGNFPVAVKLIRPGSQSPSSEQLSVEVEAAAGLDHPGVVAVYDQGQVAASAAAQSNGLLQAGQHYIVMEYVKGQVLSHSYGSLSWNQLRSILLALLDALAHAHARGVIHRDIKGGNVLLGREHRVKLTDFGIASVGRQQDGASDIVAGTPSFMAPEQFLGRRYQGPWTDLYALGCLAYALVVGVPPFRRKRDSASLIIQHLYSQPPSLPQNSVTPPGFEAWIRRLLAKSPADRFLYAADAARTLESLPEVFAGGSGSTGSLGDEPTSATVLYTLPTQRSETFAAGDAYQPPTRSAEESSGSLFLGTVESISVDWRRAVAQQPSLRLVGAGLALFRLRRPPLVGRLEERDALWTELVAVANEGGTRHLQVTGSDGAGRSTLLRWLGQRAHELGMAIPLVLGAGASPLLPALRRLCSAGQLSSEEHRKHFERRRHENWPDSPWADELSWALSETPSVTVDSAAFEDLALEVLTAWSARRTLLLIADDADAIALARIEAIVGRGGALRALVVSAARSSDLTPATGLELGPLPSDKEARMITDMGLDLRLAARVQQHSRGNPSLAVGIVSSWIEKGLLQPGKVGFRLQEGVAEESLPRNLAGDWPMRWRVFLSGWPESDRDLLELTAILGGAERRHIWSTCCEEAGCQPSPGLVRSLVREGLARRSDFAGWRFSHPAAVAALRSTATESGRAKKWHEVADRVFSRLLPEEHEKIGLHRVGAGDHGGAIDPLLAAAAKQARGSKIEFAAPLVEKAEKCLIHAAIPDTDPRWCELWRIRGSIGVGMGDREFEEVAIARCRYFAEKSGNPLLLSNALRLEGQSCEFSGRFEEAQPLLERALELARESGDTRAIANSLLRKGTLLGRLGHAEESVEALKEAIGQIGEQRTAMLGLFLIVLTNLGTSYMVGGRYRESLSCLEEGIALAERDGTYPGYLSILLSSRGETLEMMGELEQANIELLHARSLLPAAGVPDSWIIEIALARIALKQGRAGDAAPILERVRILFELSGRLGMALAVTTLQTWCSAQLGEEGELELALDRAAELRDQTGSRWASMAECLDTSAALSRGVLAARCTSMASAFRSDIESSKTG